MSFIKAVADTLNKAKPQAKIAKVIQHSAVYASNMVFGYTHPLSCLVHGLDYIPAHDEVCVAQRKTSFLPFSCDLKGSDLPRLRVYTADEEDEVSNETEEFNDTHITTRSARTMLNAEVAFVSIRSEHELTSVCGLKVRRSTRDLMLKSFTQLYKNTRTL